MLELLSIEWLKLKKYRTFWIISTAYFALLFIFVEMMRQGTALISFDQMIFEKNFSFPFIWNLITYIGSYFVHILSCLVIIIITNEYVYRTNRQNILDGLSKLKFFHAKVYLIIAIAIAATLWLFIDGLITGALSGGVKGALSSMNKVMYFFIYTLNHLGFAAMIAFLCKRSGLAIGLYLLYILPIEFILGAIMDNHIYESSGNFLPLQASDKLLPVPLAEMTKQLMHLKDTFTNESYLIASVIYIIAYYLIVRRYLLKTDW